MASSKCGVVCCGVLQCVSRTLKAYLYTLSGLFTLCTPDTHTDTHTHIPTHTHTPRAGTDTHSHALAHSHTYTHTLESVGVRASRTKFLEIYFKDTYISQKETYTRDLQKRPTKETNKRVLQKRPAKETCERDLLTI